MMIGFTKIMFSGEKQEVNVEKVEPVNQIHSQMAQLFSLFTSVTLMS